ncbi:hypothetical protein NPIL_435301 [Nephila pilipes]|uniref:Uncharacterized protein n=1 Tax=Nephila pilipes TaxID=299642 RepID=A0A8X6QC45_NEPPI|nr:hypothetical protein NPIL_435301 [Nephila pilipes]
MKNTTYADICNPDKEIQENPIETQEKSKRNNPTEEKQDPENFTFIDAVKEIQYLFRSFPNLPESCKKMKSTDKIIDKLNIFMQGIAASLP